MMKYYSMNQNLLLEKNTSRSIYKIIDFNVAVKITEDLDGISESSSLISQQWQKLVYIWAFSPEYKIDQFTEYLLENTSNELWYNQNENRSAKGALEHYADFVGSIERANNFNQALLYLSNHFKGIHGLQFNEDYNKQYGNSERERTINYINFLVNYLKNISLVYEEHYEDENFNFRP